MKAKIKALAKHLDIDLTADELEPTDYDESMFNVGSQEYLVLTDKEADTRAAASIEDSLWAFRPEFLASHSDADAEVFKTMQDTNKCESLSPIFKKLIRDWAHFVDDAIKADGRGHFISHYDGEECEVSVGTKRFYIYRVN